MILTGSISMEFATPIVAGVLRKKTLENRPKHVFLFNKRSRIRQTDVPPVTIIFFEASEGDSSGGTEVASVSENREKVPGPD
jgi:hypothetical protein